MHDQTVNQFATPATGTVTSAAAVALTPSIRTRSGFVFTNKSSYDILMRMSGTASSSNWTRRIAAGETLEAWVGSGVTPSIIGTDAAAQSYETTDFFL